MTLEKNGKQTQLLLSKFSLFSSSHLPLEKNGKQAQLLLSMLPLLTFVLGKNRKQTLGTHIDQWDRRGHLPMVGVTIECLSTT